MTKSVLLTRSKSVNAELKQSLEKHKYELLECSLIDYELQPFDLSEFHGFQNIIITSFFAANKLPDAPVNSMDAWVVGVKSAKILEAKGYKIKFISPDAETLKRQIPEEIYHDSIYPSSDQITVNMPLHITRKVFYKVSYKDSLSNEQLLRYKQGIDYVLLYSENCAKTLVKLLLENDLMNYLENTTCIAISSKVERVVKRHFRNTQICHGADLMLEYLEKQ